MKPKVKRPNGTTRIASPQNWSFENKDTKISTTYAIIVTDGKKEFYRGTKPPEKPQSDSHKIWKRRRKLIDFCSPVWHGRTRKYILLHVLEPKKCYGIKKKFSLLRELK